MTKLPDYEIITNIKNNRFFKTKFKETCNERVKGKDGDGTEIEYFSPPASLFKISFMITPYFNNTAGILKITESAVKLLKDDYEIPVDNYDWLDNNKRLIHIMRIKACDMRDKHSFSVY